jgi:hypothetical protein
MSWRRQKLINEAIFHPIMKVIPEVRASIFPYSFTEKDAVVK